jgi:hypothetical protein
MASFDPGTVYREPWHLLGAAGLSRCSEGGGNVQQTSGGPPDVGRRPPRTPWLSYAALGGWQAGRADPPILLKRQFLPTRPNTAWATDIT